MGGTTRRQFLVRGGALAGALAVGGTTAGLLPAGGTAQTSALSPARRRTYTALMEAARTQPSMRPDPAIAPGAATDLPASHAGWPPPRRRGGAPAPGAP